MCDDCLLEEEVYIVLTQVWVLFFYLGPCQGEGYQEWSIRHERLQAHYQLL